MKKMALMLALVLCLGSVWGNPVYAAESSDGVQVEPIVPVAPDPDAVVQDDGDARYTTYRYVVNVEFGSMSFYYDWGRWNVDELAYVSDSTSSAPAATTVGNAPGWYGFDGLSNRIGLNYRRVGNEAGTEYLKVSMVFEHATNADGTPTFARDHMSLSLYDTSDFGGFVADMNAQNAFATTLLIAPAVDDVATPTVDEAELMQDYYLSLNGAPYLADGTPYKNGTPTSLGLLTIRIDFASAHP
ncbi:MAG: hypothetical protein J6R04_03770 [Clostridia bacterium]|nr:hypothetical protein [Clostridia bacterium]